MAEEGSFCHALFNTRKKANPVLLPQSGLSFLFLLVTFSFSFFLFEKKGKRKCAIKEEENKQTQEAKQPTSIKTIHKVILESDGLFGQEYSYEVNSKRVELEDLTLKPTIPEGTKEQIDPKTKKKFWYWETQDE